MFSTPTRDCANQLDYPWLRCWERFGNRFREVQRRPLNRLIGAWWFSRRRAHSVTYLSMSSCIFSSFSSPGKLRSWALFASIGNFSFPIINSGFTCSRRNRTNPVLGIHLFSPRPICRWATLFCESPILVAFCLVAQKFLEREWDDLIWIDFCSVWLFF